MNENNIKLQQEILKDMVGKTEQEINYTFDTGVFNELVKCVVKMAMTETSYATKDVEKVVKQCNEILSECTAEEIRRANKSL